MDLIAETHFAELYSSKAPLTLINGKQLSKISVAYQCFGELNSANDNVVLVAHALTGNSHVAGRIRRNEIDNCSHEKYLKQYNIMYEGKEGWWSPLIGSGKAIDTDKYFVICSNVLGSCYGTSGPASINKVSNNEERLNFPNVTVRDMVNVQKMLLDELKINKIKLAVGGSLGGMQVLEWALMYGEMVESIMPIAASAGHSAWAIGFNEASRNAIMNDPAWNNGNYNTQPEYGLSLARKVAMLTYRSYSSFNKRFERKRQNSSNSFEVESYLNYQGNKLSRRFDANTYLYLSEAMDMHDVGLNRGGILQALSSISCRTNCIGISSDILYPPEEQKEIAGMIPKAQYSEIDSIHGHDAFLIEFQQLDALIRKFLH